jgi:hypothetical protein
MIAAWVVGHIGVQHVPLVKGPQSLLCAGSRAVSVKLVLSGIPNRQIYCAIFLNSLHNLQIWLYTACLTPLG